MSQATRMLEAFASVNVRTVDVTITDFVGEMVAYRPNTTIANFKRTADQLIARAKREMKNLMIRPRSDNILTQIDDIDIEMVERLKPFSFLAYETSPGNNQAWVALKSADEDFPRRLRKAIGADPGASGSTRIAGSVNHKPLYAPSYPTVKIIHIDDGKFTTQDALHQAGFVSPPEEPLPFVTPTAGPHRWPNYQRCLDGALPAHASDHPDISRVDFLFARIAYRFGHSIEEIAEELLIRSPKARNSRRRYAFTTAENAALSVQREGPRRLQFRHL